MLRQFLFVTCLLLAGGCQTLVGSPRLTTLNSIPAGAQVTIEGFGSCETPCSVEHDNIRTVTIAKAGFKKQTFEIAPGAGKIEIQLELAAPSEDIQSEDLPEL